MKTNAHTGKRTSRLGMSAVVVSLAMLVGGCDTSGSPTEQVAPDTQGASTDDAPTTDDAVGTTDTAPATDAAPTGAGQGSAEDGIPLDEGELVVSLSATGEYLAVATGQLGSEEPSVPCLRSGPEYQERTCLEVGGEEYFPFHFSWNPSGDRLAMLVGHDDDEERTKHRIWVWDAGTGEVEPVTQEGDLRQSGSTVDWADDDQLLYTAAGRDEVEIVSLRLGEDPEPFVQTPAELVLDMHLDGDRLLYTGTVDGEDGIFSVDLETGEGDVYYIADYKEPVAWDREFTIMVSDPVVPYVTFLRDEPEDYQPDIYFLYPTPVEPTERRPQQMTVSSGGRHLLGVTHLSETQSEVTVWAPDGDLTPVGSWVIDANQRADVSRAFLSRSSAVVVLNEDVDPRFLVFDLDDVDD